MKRNILLLSTLFISINCAQNNPERCTRNIITSLGSALVTSIPFSVLLSLLSSDCSQIDTKNIQVSNLCGKINFFQYCSLGFTGLSTIFYCALKCRSQIRNGAIERSDSPNSELG